MREDKQECNVVETTILDTYYSDNPEDLTYQAFKLASSYWTKRNVYDRWFKKDNINESRQKIYDYWINNVMFFLISRNVLKNWNSKLGKFSTYIYRVIQLGECIFAYQILYNLTQSEAITYSRELQENKIKAKQGLKKQQRCNQKDILCMHKSLDDTVYDDDDKTLYDTYSESYDDVEKQIEQRETIREIYDILENHPAVTDKAKTIIKTYIDCGFNYAVTAKTLNVSRQRVEQVLKKFRQLLQQKGISCQS